MRRLLAGLIVLIVASTPAADAYCRALCVTPAIEISADSGGHCALHHAAPAGAAMGGAGGPCANPHADARLQQAAIKSERAKSALVPMVMPRAAGLVEVRTALEPGLGRPDYQPLSHRSLPLRR